MNTDPNFNYCVQIILEVEGGLVDDPQDPGGVTKFGISKRAYPNLDVPSLTEEQAAQIYYEDYWVKFRCGDVPPHLDLWFLNACVMSGGSEATKLLQQLVGCTQDGVFGPATLKAVQQFPRGRDQEYLALYALHLMTLPGWAHDGHGWLNRLFRLAAQ